MRFPFPAIAAAFREWRTVHQPIPDVTEDDVRRIVRRDFPAEQHDMVAGVLDDHKKSSRVQLAALKLANGDLQSLKRQIAAAKRDYRDVLVYAEYPEYTKAGYVRVRKLRRKEQQRIVSSDWDQYQRWLRDNRTKNQSP